MVINEKPFEFAKVTNEAVRIALDKEEDLLLVNDDVFLNKDTISKMLELKDEGIVGAQLFYPDGRVQHSGGEIAGGHYHDKINADRVCGRVTFALALIPYWVLAKIGPFDERFGAYYEDDDYCRRARGEGIKCIVKHDAKAIHLESATNKQVGIDHTVGLKHYKEKWG